MKTENFLKRLANNAVSIYMSNNYHNERVDSPSYVSAYKKVLEEVNHIVDIFTNGFITENEATKMLADYCTREVGKEKLSEEDKKRMEDVNAKNNWSMDYYELVELVKEHRDTTSEYTRKLIEYRLTDINFHSEVALLCDGKYDELLDKIEEDFTIPLF